MGIFASLYGILADIGYLVPPYTSLNLCDVGRSIVSGLSRLKLSWTYSLVIY